MHDGMEYSSPLYCPLDWTSQPFAVRCWTSCEVLWSASQWRGSVAPATSCRLSPDNRSPRRGPPSLAPWISSDWYNNYNIKLCTVVLIMVTCSHVKQPFYFRDVYHESYLTYFTVWNNFQPWLNTMHCNNLNVWICKVRILRYAPITSINGPPLSQWPLGLVPRVTDYSGSTVMGWNFLFWMIL